MINREAKSLPRWLQNIEHIATSYLVFDTSTGENDNVGKNMIVKFLNDRDVPGEVVKREWNGYGDTKSKLIAEARTHPATSTASYIMFLDVNDLFVVKFTKTNVDRYRLHDLKQTLDVYWFTHVFDILCRHGFTTFYTPMIFRNNLTSTLGNVQTTFPLADYMVIAQ
jgi:hypothetical protein